MQYQGRAQMIKCKCCRKRLPAYNATMVVDAGYCRDCWLVTVGQRWLSAAWTISGVDA